MHWQNFIRGLLISTLIFGGILMSLTLFASPEQGSFTIVFYYLALFFFLLGLATLIFFAFHKWWSHNEVIFSAAKISLRQGILFAAFIIALLLLSSMQLLTWWDGIILTISFLLIEAFFKTRR
jgi:amino acid transporter